MRNQYGILLGIISAATFLGAVPTQAGTIIPTSVNSLVIDEFSDPAAPNSQSVQMRGASRQVFSQSDAITGQAYPTTILGGYRDVQLDAVCRNTSGVVITCKKSYITNSSIDVVDGSIFWSNAAGKDSIATVTWDGNDDASSINYTGLGGTDLTAGGQLDRIAVDLISADLAGLKVTFNVYTDQNNWSTITTTLPTAVREDLGNSPQRLFFEFSDFVQGAGALGEANFASVGAVQMVLASPQNGMDVQIAFVDATKPDTQEIPEPSLSLLTLMGVSALGYVSKRRKSVH
jgi:hypothetical protein